MNKSSQHITKAFHASKRRSKQLIQLEKVRFALVGGINTAIDFILLNVFVVLFGLPVFWSNIGSTTIAMFASFGLNKKAVFKSAGGSNVRQLVLFFAVTVTGLWLIQSLIVVRLNDFLIGYFDNPVGLQAIVLLNAAKIVGIMVGLVWNYLWYSKVVFKK